MRAAALLALFLTANLSISGADLSTAEVVKHAIDAMGGASEFAKIQSMRVHATIDGAKILVSAKRPDLFRVDMDGFAQGWDGTKGWQQSSELAGDQLLQLKNQASNAIGGVLVDNEKRGNHVEYLGHEKRGGLDCLKLKITLPTGAVMTEYLDPLTYLEVHEQIVDSRVIEEDVADHRKFGNLTLPCRFVSQLKGDAAKHEFLIVDVELNPAIDESIFRMPPAAGK